MLDNQTAVPARLAELWADSSLGAGNFVHHARRHHPAPDAPLLVEYGAGGDAGAVRRYSLEGILALARERASWLHRRGVRRGDRVGLSEPAVVETFVHYIALTGIGAVPMLLDPAADPALTAWQLDELGAVGHIGPQPAGSTATGLRGARFEARTAEMTGSGRAEDLPAGYPHVHAPDEVVMLSPTVGAGGGPTVRLSAHRQLFLAQDRQLLGLPFAGDDRVLLALPTSHSSLIGYLMTSVVLTLPTAVTGDLGAQVLPDAVADARPTTVVSSPHGYATLAGLDADSPATTGVHTWINVGGMVHGAHAERLVQHGRRPARDGGTPIEGSRLVDNVGTYEVGAPVFRRVHTPETSFSDGRLGRPTEIVDHVSVLDSDSGQLRPHGEVGSLAVAGDRLTPGFWQGDGYEVPRRRGRSWITPHRVYRDSDGEFFHAGHEHDELGPGGAGTAFRVEDTVLRACPEIAECAIVASSTLPADGPIAVVTLRTGTPTTAGRICARANRALAAADLGVLSAVHISDPGRFPRSGDGVAHKSALRENLTAGTLIGSESGFTRFRRAG